MKNSFKSTFLQNRCVWLSTVRISGPFCSVLKGQDGSRGSPSKMLVAWNHQYSFEKNVFRIHNRMFLKCSNANSFFGRVLNISPRNSWIRRILSVCLSVNCKRIWTFFTIRYFLLAEGIVCRKTITSFKCIYSQAPSSAALSILNLQRKV